MRPNDEAIISTGYYRHQYVVQAATSPNCSSSSLKCPFLFEPLMFSTRRRMMWPTKSSRDCIASRFSFFSDIGSVSLTGLFSHRSYSYPLFPLSLSILSHSIYRADLEFFASCIVSFLGFDGWNGSLWAMWTVLLGLRSPVNDGIRLNLSVKQASVGDIIREILKTFKAASCRPTLQSDDLENLLIDHFSPNVVGLM